VFISKPLAIGISASDMYDSIDRATHYEVLGSTLVLSKKVVGLQSVRSTCYERWHQALPELPAPQVVVAGIQGTLAEEVAVIELVLVPLIKQVDLGRVHNVAYVDIGREEALEAFRVSHSSDYYVTTLRRTFFGFCCRIGNNRGG